MVMNSKKQKAITIDREKLHAVDEAIALAKSGATSKFDETIEVAMNLGVDPRHADQMVRGVVTLPKGTGKTVRVGVFAKGAKADEAREAGADVVGAEDLMETVQGGKIEFDRCIATPDMMGVVGRLGKVLGPKGTDAQPEARHGDDGCRRRGEGGQGRAGRISCREGRDHPFRHRQGELSGRRPACELRCAARCGGQGQAVGRQGKIRQEGRDLEHDGPRDQGRQPPRSSARKRPAPATT